MTAILSYLAATLALVLALVLHGGGGGVSSSATSRPPATPAGTKAAPEIDPALGVAAITLVAGVLTVARSQRRK